MTLLASKNYVGDGATTDFGALVDLVNVAGIILEDVADGRIDFLDPITTIAGLDFDIAVDIEPRRISVDSFEFTQLNVPARLQFYGITFIEPKILRDGSDCAVCTDIVYENNILSFTVPGFSIYTVVEGYVEPESSPAPSGGGGGGGGGAIYVPPVEEEPQDEPVVTDIVQEELEEAPVADNQEDLGAVDNGQEQQTMVVEKPGQLADTKSKYAKPALMLLSTVFIMISGIFVLFGFKKRQRNKPD